MSFFPRRRSFNDLCTGKPDELFCIFFSFYLKQSCDVINISASGSAKMGVARKGHCALVDMFGNVLQY